MMLAAAQLTMMMMVEDVEVELRTHTHPTTAAENNFQQLFVSHRLIINHHHHSKHYHVANELVTQL
jgi:hypothetical protein